MKILIAIPHVFAPKKNSLYSSENESKKEIKEKGIVEATIGNLNRHGEYHWIHASLGKGKPVITRKIYNKAKNTIKIQIYTHRTKNLIQKIPIDERIEIIYTDVDNLEEIPSIASRSLLEQAANYDMVGYIEDDIAIEDRDFFYKIKYFVENYGSEFVFLPHRCEEINNSGEVILSGDPDGGREDLFWDTKECITTKWSEQEYKFYRATNPHSGCYFITRDQALIAKRYWNEKNWMPDIILCGPLEQAASGMLIKSFKIMKPIPEDYRILMVKHTDELWKRHPFENKNEDKQANYTNDTMVFG